MFIIYQGLPNHTVIDSNSIILGEVTEPPLQEVKSRLNVAMKWALTTAMNLLLTKSEGEISFITASVKKVSFSS